MTVDDEKLMAYADGELTGTERNAVEAAIAADPVLAGKVAAHRSLRGALAGAFDPVLSEALPPGLAALSGQSGVTDLAAERERHRAPAFMRWGALAATLFAGVVAGYLLAGPSGMVDGALVARGDLARALDSQLAVQDPASLGSPVRIGLTFRNRAGAYCRSFGAARADAVSGIACRSDGRWRLLMAVAAAPETGVYRQAGGDEAVAAAVEAMIDGAPLGASAEASARDAGWLR